MKWNLASIASLLAVAIVEMHPAPAEACGVKLSIKPSAARKAVARTSTPSYVLLLGSPPRRLEHDLSAAGHNVEVASSASAAKRKSYAVVMVESNDQANEARSSFADSVVVVRSGDVTADIRSVEDRVVRKPVRTAETREVVAKRDGRVPIATSARVAVTTSTGSPTDSLPPEPGPVVRPAVEAAVVPKVEEPKPAVKPPVKVVEEPKPPPVKVVTAPTKVEEPKPVAKPPVKIVAAPTRVEESKPDVSPDAPKPKAVAKANAGFHDEVYFTLGNAKANNATLVKAAKWLTENSSVAITVEGHADPTGTPENNMALAQSRAEFVRDYLVSAGIDTSRIEVISYGDTRLKYPAKDPRNRRVAIVKH